MNTNYQQKYLKYKEKYLTLCREKLIGGREKLIGGGENVSYPLNNNQIKEGQSVKIISFTKKEVAANEAGKELFDSTDFAYITNILPLIGKVKTVNEDQIIIDDIKTTNQESVQTKLTKNEYINSMKLEDKKIIELEYLSNIKEENNVPITEMTFNAKYFNVEIELLENTEQAQAQAKDQEKEQAEQNKKINEKIEKLTKQIEEIRQTLNNHYHYMPTSGIQSYEVGHPYYKK
jgi:hypothetical protein